MNTKENAIKSILSFIRSENKVLLLTGTHQNMKHVLALSVILSEYPSPATILFRANHARNIRNFLSRVLNLTKEPRIGDAIDIQGGYRLYLDTINQRSWYSSPRNIDVAVVYPLDSLGYEKGDDCVQDLIHKNAKKILLVSWTDNRDLSWTDQFNPVRVVYDGEEEDPEYHKRVLDILSIRPKQILKGLPSYAASIPNKYLIQIFCDGKCSCTRWARLNRPYPGKSALRNAQMGEFSATCLKCGYEAMDNYNWFR